MTKIWAYGNSKTKTATGEKWEGNVIAVPKGYKLGEIYTITYIENGVEKTITAKAVDRTPGDSFSAPKGSPITKALGRKDVKISLGQATKIEDVAPEASKANPESAALSSQKITQPETNSNKAAATQSFTTEQGVELAELFNKHGLRTKDGNEFSCAGCIVDAPEQAGKMAEIISQFAINAETKTNNLKAIFAQNPEALSAIDNYSAAGTQTNQPIPAKLESQKPSTQATQTAAIQEILPSQPASPMPQEENKYEAIDDKQLAQFLNKHSSVHDMTCKACITKESKTHKDEFERIILEKGTPAHLAEFNKILGIKQTEEVVKSNPQFCSIATAMQNTGMQEKTTSNSGDFSGDLLLGGYYVGGQKYGTNGFVPFAQAGAKYKISEDLTLNAGASLRPDSEVIGSIGEANFNPLEFNIKKEFENGSSAAIGLSTWIGNHNYQRDPLNSTTTLSCGCTGMSSNENSAPPTRDGIFSPALNEISIAGAHFEKQFDDETYLRASLGAPINSNVFDSDLAALIAVRHNFSDEVAASAGIAAQANQAQINAGASYEFDNKAKIAASVYGNFGERLNTAGVEVRATTPIAEKTSLSLTGLYERDMDLDLDAVNARISLQHAVTDNISVGPFLMGGVKGGEKEFGGGFGFSGKF